MLAKITAYLTILAALWKPLAVRLFGEWDEQEVRWCRERLQQTLSQEQAPCDPTQLTEEEHSLYLQIRERTDELNRNNITRTNAYLDVYQRTPELHWAFLAHMVSRNGGYSMTDLRGDLISRSMEPGEAERFFHFLERSNFLIFSDAYPQLLVYEESKRVGRPLFHLLPYFGVSCYMNVIWERFWETRDSRLLTMALVNNEQNFIEKRVVKNPEYEGVVESFEFRAQTLLNLTHVLFPYVGERGKRWLELAGVVVSTFMMLAERINTGRQLYAILFSIPAVLEGVKKWAFSTPHTGSRSDYWPHIYGTEPPASPPETETYKPRVESEKQAIRDGARPLYSPPLDTVWPDVEHKPAGGVDWCTTCDAVNELYYLKPRRRFAITDLEYETLAFVEKMVAAETWVDQGKVRQK